MKLPLVTVIIPTYKRSERITGSIDSVLKQTYNNIEIIVVDDNDPNSKYRKETEKKLKDYINYKMLTYLKLDYNHGGALARNEGLKIAKGKYVCFLDDDDRYLPNKIADQVKVFETSDNDLAVVGGFAKIIDDRGIFIRREMAEITGNVFIRQLKKNMCTTSIAMIRTDIAIKAGGFEKMYSSQEHLFFIKIFDINPNYDYVSDDVVEIVIHKGERISTNPNKPLGAIQLYEKVQKYLKNLSIETKNEVNHHQLLNIVISYAVIGDRKSALRFLIRTIKNDKSIKKDTIKAFIHIIFKPERVIKARNIFILNSNRKRLI